MVRKLHAAAELAAYKTGLLKSTALEEKEDKYIRLAAEFDNYKKRTSRQYADVIRNANEELLQDLLDVINDFQRALETLSNSAPDNKNASAEAFQAGIKMVYDKMMAVLKGRGVSQLQVMGQPFDPQFHDAVMQMPSDAEEGTIIGVVSPGYLLNEKVIRHAKVIVASSK